MIFYFQDSYLMRKHFQLAVSSLVEDPSGGICVLYNKIRFAIELRSYIIKAENGVSQELIFLGHTQCRNAARTKLRFNAPWRVNILWRSVQFSLSPAGELYQRRLPEALSCRQTHQTTQAGIHDTNFTLDFRTILQSKHRSPNIIFSIFINYWLFFSGFFVIDLIHVWIMLAWKCIHDNKNLFFFRLCLTFVSSLRCCSSSMRSSVCRYESSFIICLNLSESSFTGKGGSNFQIKRAFFWRIMHRRERKIDWAYS